jgi:hypothetical protein
MFYIVLQAKKLKKRNKILIAAVVLFCSTRIFTQPIDSLKIDYNYINSSPQNAHVYLDDKLIGSTPLFYMWEDSLFPKSLMIKMKGYIDYTDNIPNSLLINKTYKLVPQKGNSVENPVKEDKSTYFSKPRKVIPIVISSLFAAGAGVSAYYFKTLSAENRDAYELYRDPAALDRKEKYDTYAAISIILFQAGLGILAYFLFVD